MIQKTSENLLEDNSYYKIFIQGIVQGVGFRPFIYRKAVEHGFSGSVKNIGSGVEIIINDKNFINKIHDLPPLAKINNFKIEKIELKEKLTDFKILDSKFSKGETELPADIFMCKDCLKELRDKNDRRNNYYFITCTNCGPRFSMIKDYPYDRPLTSMNEFKMCPECEIEYTNPLDRRYHAQTIACKKCGPKLLLIENKNNISGKNDIQTIKKAIELIKNGEALSIKGIGGFHICSLCDNNSVKNARKLLNRKHKPFAIMIKDLEMAEKISLLNDKEKELLKSPQRPIVVVKKKNVKDFDLISELDSIGLMLPYTALHYLMFNFIDQPLLMTSCNIPGEPVNITEKIGKYFLTHERKILNRCDDSVLKVIKNTPFYLRRSRGFAPIPINIPINCEDTIAVGAELNNVIAIAKKNKCYLSQYIGETSKYETFLFLQDTIKKFIKLTRCKPKKIVCDLHPNYNSTIYAKKIAKKYAAKLIQVQHHHAHVASVAAEHNLSNYVGIAIDGLGYGEDGNIWGGEIFLVKNGSKFNRIGHLEEHIQLGGDSATIHPKKMLFGILSKFLDEKELTKIGLFNKKESKLYLNMINKNFNTPITTSTGRILDSVSAFLGFCDNRTYDGRPAMILESKARNPYEIEPKILIKKGKKVLLTTPIFNYLLENNKKDKARLAATVQMYIAKGLFEIAKEKNLPVVLSGGVAYNKMITGYLIDNGVLVHKELPSGDGCICYGQAFLANI